MKELVENALDAGARQIPVDVEEGGLALVRVADDGCGMDRDDALARARATRHLEARATRPGSPPSPPWASAARRCPPSPRCSRFRARHRDGAATAAGTRLERGGRRARRASRRWLGRAGPPSRSATSSSTPPRAGSSCARPPPRPGTSPRRSSGWRWRAPTSGSRSAPPGGSRSARAPAAAPPDRARPGARARGAPAPPGRRTRARRGARARAGLLARPLARPPGAALYLFVNGRYVRDRAAAHAVLRAFAGTLPPGRHPAGVLFVELPLGPRRRERPPAEARGALRRGREVHDALFHAVAGALRTAPWLGDGARRPPTARRRRVGGPCDGRRSAEAAAALLAWARDGGPRRGAARTSSPPAAAPGGDRSPSPSPSTDRRGARRARRPATSPRCASSASTRGPTSLCEAPGGTLVVIDQHASHERLLFQRLRAAFREPGSRSSRSCSPQVVTLPPAAGTGARGRADELARARASRSSRLAGTLRREGRARRRWPGVDLAGAARSISRSSSSRWSAAARSTRRSTTSSRPWPATRAVRANQESRPEEARALLDGLDAIDFKARCPHGRPVVFELPLADLERRVGRK